MTSADMQSIPSSRLLITRNRFQNARTLCCLCPFARVDNQQQAPTLVAKCHDSTFHCANGPWLRNPRGCRYTMLRLGKAVVGLAFVALPTGATTRKWIHHSTARSSHVASSPLSNPHGWSLILFLQHRARGAELGSMLGGTDDSRKCGLLSSDAI